MVQLKKKLSVGTRVKVIPPVFFSGEMPEPDVSIITSAGFSIPAHSKILASASPVLEKILETPQKQSSADRKVPILGVPYDAVAVFIQFIYSSKCSNEQMDNYGIHLLALSHVYSVPHLKQRCTNGLAKTLTVDNVVDVLQLAKLCDAPDLHLKCIRLLSRNFKAIEKSEGWKFLQDHDPYLELEILEFIDETETMKKRIRRRRRDQKVYEQLSEAMDRLEHICSEGCTTVGPFNMDPTKHRVPCSKFSTCHTLQLLIKHFGTCTKRVNGGCLSCKRMWQLFKLHSSICDRSSDCRVPLCRQFKLKAQQVQRASDDARWRLLARKVNTAKVVTSLSLPMRNK